MLSFKECEKNCFFTGLCFVYTVIEVRVLALGYSVVRVRVSVTVTYSIIVMNTSNFLLPTTLN